VTARFTRLAARDAEARFDYLLERNPAAALAFRNELAALLARLEAGELVGPWVHLEGLQRPVRTWPLYPLRVYYRPVPGGIVVLRVYHGARKPIARLP
jgi:plasmid stabilization system protein ParE